VHVRACALLAAGIGLRVNRHARRGKLNEIAILAKAMAMLNVKLAAVLILVTIAASSIKAIAATGFYKGETKSNIGKICYYDVLGEVHTHNEPSYALCPVSYEFDPMQTRNSPSAHPPAEYVPILTVNSYSAHLPSPYGQLGFYKSELIQGLTKICYYDIRGGTQAITISSTSICQLNYEF